MTHSRMNLKELSCCALFRTTLFLIHCFVALESIAQTNFEPALIIDHSGDTTAGFIDNRDSKRNPRMIAYKGKDGVVINYSPVNIKGFYLNSGGWYKSTILEIDKNSLDTRDVLQGTNQRGIVSDTVFLRVLIKGRMSLYYLNDENMRYHYIIEKDNKIEELRLEKRSVNSDLGPAVNVVEHYKAQLNAKFADSPDEKISSDQIRYNEESLMKVILRYNQSFELQKDSYVLSSEKMKFRFSILAGINASFLKIIGDGSIYGGLGEYNPDLSVYGGVGLVIILPKNRQVWSINNDLIYRYYSIEDKFKASQLKLFTTIRYNFLSQNPSRFFLGAGLSNAFGLTGESLPEESMVYYGKYEQGNVFELGWTRPRLSYTLRFEMTSGFCRYEGTRTKFSNFYFGIGYRI